MRPLWTMSVMVNLIVPLCRTLPELNTATPLESVTFSVTPTPLRPDQEPYTVAPAAGPPVLLVTVTVATACQLGPVVENDIAMAGCNTGESGLRFASRYTLT